MYPLWEKPTNNHDRTKRKRKPGTFCKVSYHQSVRLKSSYFRTIPGIIDDTRLERRTGASEGRCHGCDGDAITWKDPGEHFGICKTCYSQLCDEEVKA